MPNNDREVFEHLTSAPDTSIHVDFLTYAVFAHEKREWMKLWESQHAGASPSQADIDNWITNITESLYASMRTEGERFFLEAADAYLEQQLADERRNILRDAIVSEVRAASVWWKQLGMALMTAIVAPLILGGIIYAAGLYSRYVTPADVAGRLQTPATVPAAPPALPAPVTGNKSP